MLVDSVVLLLGLASIDIDIYLLFTYINTLHPRIRNKKCQKVQIF